MVQKFAAQPTVQHPGVCVQRHVAGIPGPVELRLQQASLLGEERGADPMGQVVPQGELSPLAHGHDRDEVR